MSPKITQIKTKQINLYHKKKAFQYRPLAPTIRPEVNKFEQGSSDGHQMSLAGVGPGQESPKGPMSRGRLGPGPGEGALHSEVQSTTLDSPIDRQTCVETLSS